MVREYRELSVEQLRRICDPNVFHFKSTAELPVLKKKLSGRNELSVLHPLASTLTAPAIITDKPRIVRLPAGK